MPYFVYIIQSDKDKTFYKGFTEDIEKRLIQHNNGESRYTSRKTPWKLVYLKEFNTKKEALIFEKKIKRYNAIFLQKIIAEHIIQTG
ncbi:MAG: GIY-YIG nuclease family protein [Paludibacter sp.]